MLRDRIVDILRDYLQSGTSCQECGGMIDDLVVEGIADSIIDELYNMTVPEVIESTGNYD